MPYKIFVINPGSTSTKLAFFEDEKKIFQESVFHDSAVLRQFGHINDQLDYRMEVVNRFIKDHQIDLNDVDAIAARGGSCYSVASGVYEVDDLLVQHTKEGRGGLHHVANLGVQMGQKLQQTYGGRLFTMDPTVVNEYQDLARITGLKGVYRKAGWHALNQKATARYHAERTGTRYEDSRYIICHIDGGISIAAHEYGRCIDCNDASGGEGPFTPTRMGSMAVTDMAEKLEGKTADEIYMMCMEAGGLSSHFGTSDSDVVHARVEAGDPEATRVWQAMIYQICKWIGSMSVVLKGKVDAIILTGRLCRFDDLVAMIKDYCGHIAPIAVYPSELEMEALAGGALKVLRGELEPMRYSGHPVWQGFDD